MKKLLLLAASISSATAAYADDNSKFYLRSDLGYSHFSKWKLNAESGAFKGAKGLTSSPNVSTIDLGLGYKVADKIRTELIYSYNWMPESTYISDTLDSVYSDKIKHTSSINTIMLKGNFDLIKLGGSSEIFVGAGVGLVFIKNTFDFDATINKVSYAKAKNTQKNTNLAYSVGLGFSTKLSDKFSLESQYNYSDFGRSKTPVSAKFTLGKKINYRVHSIKIGFRYDI